VLVLTADRTSNGPHLYYPDPQAPGGTGAQENWVLDNFSFDPYAEVAMVQCGENAAARFGISTEAQHDWVLRLYAKYQSALGDDAAFQRRYMTLPFEVPDRRLRRAESRLDGDEGIHATTAEGLARLRPLREGGTITHGGQTHPADGNAGMIVTDRERARAFSKRPDIAIRITGIGQSRVDKAMMPLAPVPAAAAALARAGIAASDLVAVKTHNPFAVNDLILMRELAISPDILNNNGCSLVWGHPQGPTGLRAVIELIEELVAHGGGHGLFTGCAAGDTGMAVVLHVDDAG
jgi:acetyl-CoA acetyltransferase